MGDGTWLYLQGGVTLRPQYPRAGGARRGGLESRLLWLSQLARADLTLSASVPSHAVQGARLCLCRRLWTAVGAVPAMALSLHTIC